jgi:hypothetical protein
MTVGLDIGTMNIVSARMDNDAIQTKRIRDAFLDLPKMAKKVLKMSGASFVERDHEIFLLGDNALDMANVFGKEVRRPLSQGLVSPSETDSLEVLGFLIKEVLGEAEDGETCFFSVPAPPIDNKSKDIIYHRGIFTRIVSDLGYNAHASNEAMAIIFSEAVKENFSALSFSFGSGMTNVALAFNGIEGMTFSIERGGDWIDHGAAQSIGAKRARICAIKEAGVDLLDPKNREEEALTFYYKALINYVLSWVGSEFKAKQLDRVLTKKVPIILSGGTSTAINFETLFREEFDSRNMGIKISDIRSASDPLNSVAKGLLVQALNEEDE